MSPLEPVCRLRWRRVLAFAAVACCWLGGGARAAMAQEGGVVYEGGEGIGAGKHIVLVAGDEEYRSEEALPQLGKILAVRHGFRCTVLFSVDPATGQIDPDHQTNLPGLATIDSADLLVVFLRFREWPDEEMKHFVDYVESGKPIVGLRTATHAFSYTRDRRSPYAKYSYNQREWPGGFGQQVLGETWVDHHGAHGRESTRGVVNPRQAEHPILRGVEDVWGPTDVYTVRNLPETANVLLRGQVLAGMAPDSPPVAGRKNDPLMPLAWTREYTGESGKASRVFCTTMGAATDLSNEGVRRLLVNACLWGLAMEERIGERTNVELVGEYAPSEFGFDRYRRGVMPADHALAPPLAPSAP